MLSEEITAPVKQYSLDEAFSYCEATVNARYENFPVASLFLPQEKRPYIQAIYAFSRVADDFADESDRTQEERLQELDAWEQKLKQCYEGNADHPVFIALSETVKRLDIPIDPLKNLLSAFRRDVVQHRYETFGDVLEYCVCSANPVGRLVLTIFGHRDDVLLRMSDDICTALQLANFWQDVFIDRQRDRLYIPLEDMRRYGYSLEDWRRGVMNEKFREMMKFQVGRTRELFYRGAKLPSLVERELQVELRLVWFGGMAILKGLDRVGYDVLHRRPTLKGFQKGLILLRALIYNDITNYGKKRKAWDLT